jgi:hypothetical protein
MSENPYEPPVLAEVVEKPRPANLRKELVRLFSFWLKTLCVSAVVLVALLFCAVKGWGVGHMEIALWLLVSAGVLVAGTLRALARMAA